MEFKNVSVSGFRSIVSRRGSISDSEINEYEEGIIGKRDLAYITNAGLENYIHIAATAKMPLYLWMLVPHKNINLANVIRGNMFELTDFQEMDKTEVDHLNRLRDLYVFSNYRNDYYLRLIKSIPLDYIYEDMLDVTYRDLIDIVRLCKDPDLITWIKTLPCGEDIILVEDELWD